MFWPSKIDVIFHQDVEVGVGARCVSKALYIERRVNWRLTDGELSVIHRLFVFLFIFCWTVGVRERGMMPYLMSTRRGSEPPENDPHRPSLFFKKKANSSSALSLLIHMLLPWASTIVSSCPRAPPLSVFVYLVDRHRRPLVVRRH